MLGFNSSIDYLGLPQIAPLVERYVVSKNPFIEMQLEGLDDNGKIRTLASTPQWTYVQILDQYITCQLGKRQYSILLKQQSILGINVLPASFSKGLLYIQKFFEFQLHLRQYDDTTIDKLIKQSKELPYTKNNDELARLKDLIRLIQEFELKSDDNPNYTGSKEENEAIDEQLDDMEGLFLAYLDYKPGVKRIAKNYGY